MNIFIIGSGTMGQGIMQTLASYDHDITVFFRSEASRQKGLAALEKSYQKLVERGKISEVQRKKALSNIEAADSYDAAKEADLVIEAAVEDMALKKELFRNLDDFCASHTILATNTSSLSITELAVATRRPQKVIGMHFFNPVPVMKLVEVIKGQLTSQDTAQTIVELAKAIGKTPVLVEEAPGFVVNRILIPMINEATGILADQVASKEDIDQAMMLGANHPIGPLALGDLIGLDVCLAVMEVLYEEYNDPKYRPHPLLRKMVRAGQLGRKSKQGFYTY